MAMRSSTARAAAKRPAPLRSRAAPAHRTETASAAIYRILRDEILWLKRKPGEPIVEKEIAQARGVSRTPVREALLRLTNEGLVDTIAQSGTFVARIPATALPEAIVVRKALEQVNARAAAEHARGSDIARLRTTLEQQREAVAAGDRAAFHRADEAFHASLAAAAGYPGIWTLIVSVKTQIDRYRLLTLPQPGRMARVIKEHAAVVGAVEKRDPERAARAMEAHLDGLRVSMDDIRRLNADFFYEDIHGKEDLLR
ncbi:MAG TPA: GntR family transcriptional regulator [Casimicrobiaceae bacterium]|nr:GntR family transcriptional regulator [Casimicrobiaceae bacterium]